MMILDGHTALRYWSLLSSQGGLGAVHGLMPLTPRDLRELAFPHRRGPVPSGSPTASELERVERLGLTEEGRPVTVLVGHRDSRRRPPHVTCIVCSVELPARCLYPLCAHGRQIDGLYVCSPELAICHVFAKENPNIVTRLRLLLELTGSYRLVGDELRTHCPPVTSVRAMRSFTSRAMDVRGRSTLADTLPFAMEGSASPAETALAIAFSLPLRHGGARLGKPVLNRELHLNPQARAILGRDTITPDLLFFGPKTSSMGFPLEYESRKFHSVVEQAAYDETRRNTYAAMGSGCFLARPKHMKSARAFDAMAAVVAKNTGIRLSPLDYSQQRRHEAFLDQALELWRAPGKVEPSDEMPTYEDDMQAYEDWLE